MEKRSNVEFKYHLLFNKLMPKSNDPILSFCDPWIN